MDSLSDIILWKLRYATNREYSDEEAQEIVEEAAEQSIRDYQTVTETVEEMGDAREPQNTQVEETPPQQLGRCGCGKQQESTQRSVGKTATEQESVTNTTRVMQSLKASVSAIPLVNVEVGGKTTNGDETTNTEISTFNTIDRGTFPICPDRGCEEHLKMMGMIESWKMRNDSTRKYSDEEVDEKLMNVIAQEINNDKITTKAKENVREAGIVDSDSLTDAGERSADTEATAASAVTDALYEQLDGIEAADEGSTVQPDALDDKIDAIGTEFTRIENGVAELKADPNTNIKSDAKQQQLLDRLAAMNTQDEETEAQIDQLTESISTIDPQLPQADDQLDLFAGQISDLEANDDVHTNLAVGTAGQSEIQQLDSRLDAIDANGDADEIMQQRDTLKQDLDLLDRRYDRTTENIAELDPDQDTHADQTEAPETSEEADVANTSEDSETTEAADQREETNTTGQTTDTPESDGGPPAADGSDDRGGEPETDSVEVEESPTVDPDTEPAQATADASSDEADQSEPDDIDPADQTDEPEVNDKEEYANKGEPYLDRYALSGGSSGDGLGKSK